MNYLNPFKRKILLLVFGSIIIFGASACGAFVDRNEPDFNELVEEADNQATLEGQTFEDVIEDPELEGTAVVPDTEPVDPEADVPPEELPVVDQADAPEQPRGAVRMTELFDKEVFSVEGEELGEVSDFSINAEQNRVEYILVTFVGFLNLANETIALPLDILQFGPENQLTINIDREVLETAPGFDSSNITGSFFIQESWSDEADAFWAQQPGHVRLAERGEEETPSGIFVSASSLLGYEFTNENDETLGQISDFIFDFSEGRVSYAVLSSDVGPLDVDSEETLYLIPINTLTFLPEINEVQVAVGTDSVQNSPQFNPENFPDLDQPDWDSEVKSYWSEQGVEITEVSPDQESTQTDDVFDDNELYDDTGLDEEEIRSQESETDN